MKEVETNYGAGHGWDSLANATRRSKRKEKSLEECKSKEGYLGRGMEAKEFRFYLVSVTLTVPSSSGNRVKILSPFPSSCIPRSYFHSL